MALPPARASALRRRLLAWWDAGHRDLPWRFPQQGADPYRVWIAEVMLQQTRVAVVVPYYERFVCRFPTLGALAGADEDEVLALWSGLGYYGRARRLLAAAREALARFGALPPAVEDLETLPGFGRYTARAVASIAFAVRAPCVDGNVARVLSRLFLVDSDPGAPSTREALWEAAGALVPPRRPGDFNQALMELGATVCTPGVPSCTRCPLRPSCLARRSRRETDVPSPRARKPRRSMDVACAVVRCGDAVLLVRRAGEGLFAGLWALPFALVDRGEDARHALAHVVLEATGAAVHPGAELATVERVLTHRRLWMTAYDCGRAPPSLRSPAARWHPAGTADLVAPRGGGAAGDAARPAMVAAMRALIDALPVPGGNPLTRQGATV